jgi:hypothetical protein
VKTLNVLSRVWWYVWRNDVFYFGWFDLLSLLLQPLLITLKYGAITDLHNLQFAVAHALGFSVSTSRLLATDLNTDTITSNHYEGFLSSVTLYSSVLICTRSSQFTLHSRPCTLSCWTLLGSPHSLFLCRVFITRFLVTNLGNGDYSASVVRWLTLHRWTLN